MPDDIEILEILAKAMGADLHEADLPGDPRSIDELMSLGWIYFNIPWCLPHVWEQLFDIVGPSDYKLLAKSIQRKTGAHRGQWLISPTGMQKLKAVFEKQN